MSLTPSSPSDRAVAANPARHDVVMSCRDLLPILTLFLAVFVVLAPLSTAAIPEISLFNIEFTHDQLKFRFFANDLLYPVIFASALFGLVTGLMSFRFMLVKRETTLYFSLPLSRGKLYRARIIASLLALIVGIGIPMLVSLLVNITAVGVWEGLFEQFVYVLLGLLLTAVLAFALTTIACSFAGTVPEALLFALALMLAVSSVTWSVGVLMNWLLVGNAAGEYLISGSYAIAPPLLESLAPFNPLLFFATEAGVHQSFLVIHPVYVPTAGNWPLLVAWACVCVVLLVLGLLAFNRRKGENAAITGSYPFMSLILGLVVGIAAFAMTFSALINISQSTALVASFVVFIILSIVLLRLLLSGRMWTFKTAAILVGETLGIAALVLLISTGWFGFSSTVPAAANIKQVEVSYAGSPNYAVRDFNGSTSGGGAYYFSTPYGYNDPTSIETVRQIHANLITTGRAKLASNLDSFAATVVPYDVLLRYHLADGSVLERYYDRACAGDLFSLAALDSDPLIAVQETAVITGDTSAFDEATAAAVSASSASQAYKTGKLYLSDAYLSAPWALESGPRARTELLKALAVDIAAQSVAERYHPQEAAVGAIMFTQAEATDAATFAYAVENTVIYLTPQFTTTLAWIDHYGLSKYLTAVGGVDGGGGAGAADGGGGADGAGGALPIESIAAVRYDPYAKVTANPEPKSLYFMAYRANNDSAYLTKQDFGTATAFTNAQRIAELAPLLRSSYFMDGGGYLICAKIAGGAADAGGATYTYYFLPQALAPEWLVDSMGETE